MENHTPDTEIFIEDNDHMENHTAEDVRTALTQFANLHFFLDV